MLAESKSDKSDDLKHLFKNKNKSVISKVPQPIMLVVEDFTSPGGASRESAISGKQIISPLYG